MYSSKPLFPKKAESYTTIGDPYVKKDKANDRFKGKQFTVTGSKSRAAAGEGCFGKLTYKPDGYQDRITFLKAQPLKERKLGFGTRDAFKSAEFTNTIRTQQYRELLSKEVKLVQAAAHATAESEEAAAAAAAVQSRCVYARTSEAIGYHCDVTHQMDKAEHGVTSKTAEFFDRSHLS